jgi:cystathionine gamma-synthase
MDHDPHTLALHADDLLAELPDVAPAIRPSSTFEHSAGPHRSYRRNSHETVERLEAVLGALDGGTAVAYPSGMAAISAVLRRLRPARVALPEDVYHGTAAFVNDGAGRGDWEVVGPEALRTGDVWWLETPSNPRCLITDLEATAAVAGARGAVTVVDATFATPVLMQPLRLGADVVVHSSTKFVAGHSDAMGGVVVAADGELAAALRADRTRDGAVPGSLDSWLTLRGVRTLPIRIERQCATAGRLAEWLVDHVDTVWYPGLAAHPGHDVAAAQMAGFGAIVSFEVDPDVASITVERLRLFRDATSLGGVESLAEHRLRSDPTAPPGLIRLSVGLEAPRDLIADLQQALGTTR